MGPLWGGDRYQSDGGFQPPILGDLTTKIRGRKMGTPTGVHLEYPPCQLAGTSEAGTGNVSWLLKAGIKCGLTAQLIFGTVHRVASCCMMLQDVLGAEIMLQNREHPVARRVPYSESLDHGVPRLTAVKRGGLARVAR